jgi:hypothetical protein
MILRSRNVPWIILFVLLLGFVAWLLSKMAEQVFDSTAIAWLIVGLVLFGAAAIIAMRKTAEETRDICPECGEDMEKGATECPNCGHPMQEETREEQPANSGSGRERDREPDRDREKEPVS